MTELEFGLQAIDKILQDSVTGRERFNERWESFTDQFIDAIKTAKVYVDCGAEYGFYLRLAVKYGSPNLLIWAFEPEPTRFQLLVKAFANYPNVMLFDHALSDCLSETNLIKPGVGISSSLPGKLHADGDKIPVHTSVLDIVITRDIDVLKMDIEGAEDLAILGGLRRIDESKNITLFIEFHPNQSDERLNTYRYLLALGFQVSDDDAAKMIHGGRVTLRRS